MRVSIINSNLVGQDAVGQTILHQVRFFRRRGDVVRIFSMQPPVGVPADIEKLVQVVDLAALIAHRDQHFVCSDLYIYHYPGRYPLLESIKGIDRGGVIFFYHNVTPPELWESRFAQDDLRHSADSVGALARYADCIVTVSEFNAEQLVSEHACERDQIRVLPLGTPLDAFSPGPPDLALVERYGLAGKQVILFVGRMAGNKRVDLLVEALPLVRQQVPNARLLLVGDGHSNPAHREVAARARKRAEELGVHEDVIFTGTVDDVAPFFRLADVYATASLHEGFGVPLIEAMASGVPVVASNATAHPWVVGDAGLLVTPGDPQAMAEAIVDVLTDDELHGDLVRRGLARAQQFSLERHEIGWSRIVDEVIEWLPAQAFPRPRSIPAQPLAHPEPPAETPPDEEPSASTVQEVLWSAELESLHANADVMLRGYAVHSKLPLVGRLIAWIRRNLTSHLREPYVDPMFERQVAFNRQVIDLLEAVTAHLSAAPGGADLPPEPFAGEDVQTQLQQIEAWLDRLSARIEQADAGQIAPADPAHMDRLQLRVKKLQRTLSQENFGE